MVYIDLNPASLPPVRDHGQRETDGSVDAGLEEGGGRKEGKNGIRLEKFFQKKV
jgi:hypothetical protein